MRLVLAAALLSEIVTIGKSAGSPYFFLKNGRPSFMEIPGSDDPPSWFEEATELPKQLHSTQSSKSKKSWTRKTSSFLDQSFKSNTTGESFFDEVLAPQIQTLE